MMIHIENLRDAVVAAAIGIAVATALILFEGRAHAQGCVCVTDPPVEVATGKTAESVTTGGGAGAYTPNSQYISSLDNTLFSGINSQDFAENFPGWVALPATSTQTAKAVTATTLRTYVSALATAQAQANELAGESFSGIERVSGSTTNLLAAVQANTEAVLQVAQQVQLERQLLITLITVQTTDAAERLNERSQEGATNAKQFNLGVTP